MTRVPWHICGGIRFFFFCPEELFVWQALGFQHFRLLGFHISDYWISTCPDSWKFRLPRFQFFGFPDFILWMFLYEMNSQEFLDNCLVFLLVLVSCSCEECKTCFFTYYRTQEHMYAHPGTFSKEAKAFILGNYCLRHSGQHWDKQHFIFIILIMLIMCCCCWLLLYNLAQACVTVSSALQAWLLQELGRWWHRGVHSTCQMLLLILSWAQFIKPECHRSEIWPLGSLLLVIRIFCHFRWMTNPPLWF